MSFEYDASITCEACGGDGHWDWVEAAPGTLDGTVSGRTICRACDGKGERWVHMRPVDFEDTADEEHYP